MSVSDSSTCPWDSSPSVRFYMILLQLILFDFITFGGYPLEVCSFLVRDRKEVDLAGRESGEELGGVEVRKVCIIIIRIYCRRNE